ncbi:hypothetical protein [Nocardia beijingensis]|uniref:hypothetical protein n=1 Tax=Nocardia beijingensis TaxID=95162 RepID=UPI0033DE2419
MAGSAPRSPAATHFAAATASAVFKRSTTSATSLSSTGSAGAAPALTGHISSAAASSVNPNPRTS